MEDREDEEGGGGGVEENNEPRSAIDARQAAETPFLWAARRREGGPTGLGPGRQTDSC